jgi:hypothetical protein
MVIWQRDLFERFIFRRLRIVRQHLFMDTETGLMTWRDVK